MKIPTLDEVLRLIQEKRPRPVWVTSKLKVVSPGIHQYDLLKQIWLSLQIGLKRPDI